MTPAPDTSPEAVEKSASNLEESAKLHDTYGNAATAQTFAECVVMLRALSGELARARERAFSDYRIQNDEIVRLQAEVAALKERLEASERDAARYRAIREGWAGTYSVVESASDYWGAEIYRGEALDKYIDADIAAEKAALARGGQG